MEVHGIGAIDLVVCNLYPFETVVAGRAGLSDSAVTDEIDIGGVTMIRAAAKAFCEGVTVVVDPAQYKAVADEMTSSGGSVSYATRRALARTAFKRTRDYDAAIAAHLGLGDE